MIETNDRAAMSNRNVVANSTASRRVDVASFVNRDIAPYMEVSAIFDGYALSYIDIVAHRRAFTLQEQVSDQNGDPAVSIVYAIPEKSPNGSGEERSQPRQPMYDVFIPRKHFPSRLLDTRPTLPICPHSLCPLYD